MSDARSSDSDPSMDDILASIRKIISDDEARAQVAGQTASSPATSPPPRPPIFPSADSRPATTPRPISPTKRDDVLLLTDLIEEPSRPLRPVAPPVPLPRIDPASAAEMPQPNVDPTPAPSSPGSAPASDPLIGETVAGVTSSAFERLSQAVQESVPSPAVSDPGPAVGASGKSIEDLVKEMLRPMLKEWLDRNLPPMVERFVEREIARLTRR
jgi:cell pole-organizing protein PopZ